MAQLPGERWLIQQISGRVVIFERYTEVELLSFNPSDADQAARAQEAIHNLDALTDEQKCFAHFWSGYFYAYANQNRDAFDHIVADNFG